MYSRILVLVLFSLIATSGYAQQLYGPTAVVVNCQTSFTYNNGAVVFPTWQISSNGTIVSTNQVGYIYTANVKWTSGTSGTITFKNGTTTLATSTVTISAIPLAPTPTSGSRCGTGTVSLSASPGASGGYVRWYTASSGGTYVSQSTTYTTPSISSTTNYYITTYDACSNTESSPRTLITATVYSTPAAPSTATNGIAFLNGAPTISVGTVSGATSYKWYSVSSGGTAINGATSNSYSPVVTATTNYYVSSVAGGVCESSGRKMVTATLEPDPIVSVANNVVVMGANVTLDGGAGYSSYIWKNSSGVPVGSSQIFETAIPDTYRVTVTKAGVAGASSGSTGVEVKSQFASMSNQNYIISNTLLTPVANESDIALQTVNTLSQTVQYFDGLGRPRQTVATQASPGGLDVVQPMVYDDFGREHRKYLPVAMGTDGWFKEVTFDANGNYTGIAGNTYANNTTGKIAQDSRPFAETRFEPSPLNRILEQGAPGSPWQPDAIDSYTSTDRTLKKAYEFNLASEVLLWTCTNPTATYPLGLVNAGTASAPVYYATNQLYKNKTKDEEHREVIEYVDKLGRTVLKRVQVSTTNNPSTTDANRDTNWASTYYIYNDFGNLVCVIPPEATRLLSTQYFHASATDATKDAFLGRWSFRYAYDSRLRMTHKQVPGAAAVYMVYDKRDRLVLTQDGNQRTPKQWLFTKYDALDRPVLTGIHTADSTLVQNKMQRRVDAYYAAVPGNNGAWYESYIGITGVHGYDNKSYPVEATANNYLTVTYYDNYNFKSLWPAGYDYETDNLSETVNGYTYTQPDNTSYNQRVIGQVTGTKVKILESLPAGSALWLRSANYYDEKYRNIQSKSDNTKAGIDRTSNLYDFTGKVLKSITIHQNSDVQWRELTGGVYVAGSSLRKSGASGWNAGAISEQVLPAGIDGWLEFTALSNAYIMVGFTTSNNTSDVTSMTYGFHLQYTNTNTYVRENTTNVKTLSTPYAFGDRFKIERVGTTIKYFKNDVLVHTSTIPSTTDLFVDAALYSSVSILGELRTSFGGTTNTVARTFTYDHAGRLTHTWHRLNGGTNILLSKNEYNELGQLVDKKLHSTVATASNAKQSVDYRYNIRGWLTSMNNASLTTETGINDELNDYFGMSLTYNAVDADLGNSQLYNGNISGMKWSNYGDGTIKQKGYTYTYDPMNRITGSTYKEKTATWAALANSGFAETGFTYDLNGNIKSLTRNDKRASGTMDILGYDYGTSTTQSNRLLKVTDTGDINTGFKDGNTTGNDYTYDANGNMTVDLNKGISAITYNHLNLPFTVTKGGNTVTYLYDATGRKLAQVVNSNGTIKQTDYAGEFVYENDVLQFVSHEEGRIVTGATKLVYTNPGQTLTDFTASNATISAVTANGTEKYVQVVSSGAVVPAGVTTVGGVFPVIGGERYKIRVKGYHNSATTTYLASLRVQVDGVTVPASNAVLPKGKFNESWVEVIVTIPGTATQKALQLGVLWQTSVVANETILINEVEIVQLLNQTPEYQYNLKDHLGNTRLTFTTKEETISEKATMETANANTEATQFLYYNEAKKVNEPIFDKTNAGGTYYATRLTGGTTNAIYGLAKSISVMPGDVVNMEVYAKYVDTNTANWTSALNTLMTAIAAGTAAPGVSIDGGTAGSLGTGGSYPFTPINHTSETGTPPKAYLNYILFNKDMTTVLASNFARITTNSREYGQDVAHDKLVLTDTIEEPGYMYIYLSNENPTAVEVYFDDFKVDHIKSPIVQVDDYYPFGLTFNSYNRENSLGNQYLYNGKERQDELDLSWLDYGARMYMPEIGRWGAIDPHAWKYEIVTPYNYAFNNPLLFIDPNGKDNIIYLLVAGDFSKKQAEAVASQANAMLRELGLKTEVRLYDDGKYGKFSEKNLDPTDNWAIIGSDRKAIAEMAKEISPDKNMDNKFDDWGNRNDAVRPELSSVDPDVKGIVIDHNQNLSETNKSEGSALTLIHGAGHGTEEFANFRHHPFGHTTSGVMQDGQELKRDYNRNGTSLILDKSLNGDYIKAMESRYGTKESRDFYLANMLNNSNKNSTKK